MNIVSPPSKDGTFGVFWMISSVFLALAAKLDDLGTQLDSAVGHWGRHNDSINCICTTYYTAIWARQAGRSLNGFVDVPHYQ